MENVQLFQLMGWRSGKENQPSSPREVHHIPRKPDAHYNMYDTTDTDLSQFSLRDDVSETDSERRMVKRKVLRYT